MSKKQILSPGSAWHAAVTTARRTSLAVLMAGVPVLAVGIATPVAYGQASSSSDAQGKVTDVTGASVPGATVHLVNNGTKAERTATTNDSGDWSVPNLPPANYTVRVEKQGFKKSVIPSLDVEIGKSANGSVTLAVGGTDETVEVSALPPQLQTQEATVGQVIDQKQINDLPLNGRNVLQLATLAPGVSPAQQNQTGNPCAACGSRSLYITVDGGRASSTNYVLDGTYIRSIRFNTLTMTPNTDTIQEFNLLRNSFGVEYGQGVAVVSMVTKAGSNSIHGSAYEFARNAIFDAKNYFNTGAKPDFTRNQFGGTVGLPIIKDKVFAFGGYEGLRTSQGRSLYALYPTQGQLAANYKMAAVINPTIPTPNGNYQGGAYNYFRQDNFVDNYDQYTIRSDQSLSARHTMFERYINYSSAQFTPAVQGGGQSNPLNSRNAVIGDTFIITPNVVNELRVGYNYFYNYGVGVNVTPGRNWTADEGLQNLTALNDPSEYGRPALTISSFTSNIGTTGTFTLSDNGTDQGDAENSISVGDSVSIVKGKHTLKTGFQFQNRRLTQKADNNGRGSFTFTTLAAYNNGVCDSQCNGNTGNTIGHYRDNTYGAFISDVWQAGHHITVNAGLRWEYTAPFVEQNGLEGTLDPTSGKIKYSKVPAGIPPAFLNNIDTTSTFAPGIINPNKKLFGPRVGVAYEAHPGTVIRAGFGLYFDNINANELQFTRYAAPLYYQQSFTSLNLAAGAGFPNPLTATVLPAPFSIRPNNSAPYVMEYNASIQQDLGHGLIVELAYTGSGTRKLWKRYDQNMDELSPGSTAGQGVRPFPAFSHGILTSSTGASASFNGGSIKVEKRAKNGLFLLGSYQWSKNIDNASGEAAANDTSYATNFAFDRSYSNFDVRNRAVISGGYELPFGKGKDHLQKGIGNLVAGGWSLQPAIQLRTGYPFSPSRGGVTFGNYTPGRVFLAPGRTLQSAQLRNPSPFHWFDATAFSTNPAIYCTATGGGVTVGATASNCGLPTLQGTVTRNTLRGPGTAQVDLSAIKNFSITERVRTQFRAEAYNIINRGIFSTPASTISTTNTVGRVSSTANDNRSIQLAVKVLF